ncbi:DUF4065 domain-containing protein [Limnothrix sp. FACHB-1083]|uniref:Panacea domain-containing protein n=1 Tax=unclassified Limnothrix TaxID=2632864 RepID=UPI0016806193|nr:MULTISPECIES: type II toxin-antitoxin system antitoxin SocA domain-containing protein [unclassified Limnothrix]MBD2160358.1 DUF4065 domain-containing protein [Limnothrix sp. FACHB-1083]MBD2191059.1 DUF4065 domain-containing protein [Limnothrix sp. FACHB-1088]
MISCLDAAQYFIARAYEDGLEVDITNMKVQKLLYYAQSLHLALYDQPLFAEEIQAWRYGPVCPPAYRFYSDFEAQQLPFPERKKLSHLSKEIQSVLDEVWDHFGNYHAYRLSDMSHGEFPWQKARRGLPAEASSTQPISLNDLKALGDQKLEQIERSSPVYDAAMTQTLHTSLTNPPTATIEKGAVNDWLNSLLD